MYGSAGLFLMMHFPSLVDCVLTVLVKSAGVKFYNENLHTHHDMDH